MNQLDAEVFNLHEYRENGRRLRLEKVFDNLSNNPAFNRLALDTQGELCNEVCDLCEEVVDEVQMEGWTRLEIDFMDDDDIYIIVGTPVSD